MSKPAAKGGHQTATPTRYLFAPTIFQAFAIAASTPTMPTTTATTSATPMTTHTKAR